MNRKLIALAVVCMAVAHGQARGSTIWYSPTDLVSTSSTPEPIHVVATGNGWAASLGANLTNIHVMGLPVPSNAIVDSVCVCFEALQIHPRLLSLRLPPGKVLADPGAMIGHAGMPECVTFDVLDVSPDGALQFEIEGARYLYAVGLTLSNTPTAVEELAPARLGDLRQNAPNPFDVGTEIRFALTQPGLATLRIFDVQGRVTRTFPAERFSSGGHALIWDGRDDDGRSVEAGVYFYELETAGRRAARRAIKVQ